MCLQRMQKVKCISLRPGHIFTFYQFSKNDLYLLSNTLELLLKINMFEEPSSYLFELVTLKLDKNRFCARVLALPYYSEKDVFVLV